MLLPDFPCSDTPLIYHHQHAAETYLFKHNYSEHNVSDSVLRYKTHHICEYMLTVDKVKIPSLMYSLHNISFPYGIDNSTYELNYFIKYFFILICDI